MFCHMCCRVEDYQPRSQGKASLKGKALGTRLEDYHKLIQTQSLIPPPPFILLRYALLHNAKQLVLHGLGVS
jgi:hypothetical protein